MSFRKGPSPFCLSFAPCKVQAQRYATANSPPQTVSFRFVKGHSQRCTGVQRAFQPRAKLAMSDSGTENRFSRTALGFSVSHAAFFRFDCRHFQRPAPAGRVTRARGSLTISEKKTEISDFETEKCYIWLAMNTRFRLRGEDRNFQKNKAARCSLGLGNEVPVEIRSRSDR